MNITYRRATLDDARELMAYMREEDRAEVIGTGRYDFFLPFHIAIIEAYSYVLPDGRIAAIGGIEDTGNKIGKSWLLCTTRIYEQPRAFARAVKRGMEILSKPFNLIWNQADYRNTAHRRLMKFLGYKALRIVNTGPFFLPYLEVVKLCVYSPQYQQLPVQLPLDQQLPVQLPLSLPLPQ